jgi:hypothetical protein
VASTQPDGASQASSFLEVSLQSSSQSISDQTYKLCLVPHSRHACAIARLLAQGLTLTLTLARYLMLYRSRISLSMVTSSWQTVSSARPDHIYLQEENN